MGLSGRGAAPYPEIVRTPDVAAVVESRLDSRRVARLTGQADSICQVEVGGCT